MVLKTYAGTSLDRTYAGFKPKQRTVLGFQQKVTLENAIPLGCSLLLPVDTIISVQTRKTQRIKTKTAAQK